MALILAPVKKSWQDVTVKAPSKKGFTKQVFEAQFEVPEQDEFEQTVKECTVEQCLNKWFVNARKLQLSEDDAKEVEFTDNIKTALIKTSWVRASLWETLQDVMSGGRVKN